MVNDGNFREDLYYRLSVASIKVPPLRERRSDIPLLIGYLLKKINSELHRNIKWVEEKATARLMAYDWPGNVRELENSVERTVALTESSQITLDDLPPNISGSYREAEDHSIHVTTSGIDLVKTVSQIEIRMITEALHLTNGVKAQAASLLNLNRTTLVEKMRRLGIQP